MLLPIYVNTWKGLNELVSKLKLVLSGYLVVCDVLENHRVVELVPVLEFNIIEELELLVLFIYGTGT